MSEVRPLVYFETKALLDQHRSIVLATGKS